MWGFTDRHSWIPAFSPGMGAALIFDAEYRPKPAYDALREALTFRESDNPNRATRPEDYGAECDCVP
jgi:hypothetical protein